MIHQVHLLPQILISQARNHHGASTSGVSASSQQRSQQQGLTLLECVMAIAVIAVSAGVMLPPLFVASATRVQNRKVEQAMQLAQGEIDRVRAIVEQQQFGVTGAPQLPSTTYNGAAITDITTVAAPSSIETTKCRSINPTNNTYDVASDVIDGKAMLPIDSDGIANANGTCDAEFLMQTFRTDGQSFDMGVRVYSGNVNPVNQTLDIDQASLKPTTGTGQQTVKPLAVMYTNIADVNQADSMCRFQAMKDC